MKTHFIKQIKVIIILMFFSLNTFAQWGTGELNISFTLPEIALIDIEPGVNNDINFVVNQATESGDSPSIEQTTNSELWINYSSSLRTEQNSRKIMAEISQGTVPNGIRVFLQASSYAGAGGGQLGNPAGRVRLATSPKPIISNIGNAFTGDGINNGHRLTFSLDISNYSKIVSNDNASFTVLYTITEN